MPNHVYTSMIITGVSDIVKTFSEKHFTNDQFDLNTFIEMPKDLENTTAPSDKPNLKFIKKYGADNWYDWKITNWGTKWNTYDGDMDVSTPNTIECNFQTAWSLPEPIFEEVAKMYPELEFHATTVEEGGYFSGTFEIVNGEVDYAGLNDDQDQWKQFAEEMMGWDFSDDEEDETPIEEVTTTQQDNDVKRVQAALDGLRSGEVTDRTTTNDMVVFINENINAFIKFSKPN